MKKFGYILFVAGCCASCASQTTPPIDDTYHWVDSQPVVTQPQTVQTAFPVTEKSAKPVMEIVSQQDTTITVRIKR